MTMREIQYKTFSLRTHKKNWRIKKPNVCQFELTFGCGLHCRHCNTDCYNSPAYLKKELTTGEVKFILDKVYQAGGIWLCFTGGDPLSRKDFLDIYSYAKNKGFIITIFTNAYSMTKGASKYLKNKLPFAIEITINAVTEELYEKISGVKGSFKKTMEGIGLILEARLPLAIKTQIARDNLGEIPKIKKFVEGLGLKFIPSYDLYARLNRSLAPCKLRIAPHEVLGLDGKEHSVDEECIMRNAPRVKSNTSQANLFNCAIDGGDGFNIDPYGNTFPCSLIRKPVFNLLKVDIGYAVDKLLPLVRNRKFIRNSRCNGCNLREICHWCPGKAHVEKGDMEQPIEYYCKLAYLTSSQKESLSRDAEGKLEAIQ